MSDIDRITPFEEGVLPYNIASQQTEVIPTRGVGSYIFEQVYRFSLGVIAGIAGTLVVYPIDSVKTRIQNQRSGTAVGKATGTMMYNGYADCFRKVNLILVLLKDLTGGILVMSFFEEYFSGFGVSMMKDKLL